jgi:hypothetical protein
MDRLIGALILVSALTCAVAWAKLLYIIVT